MRFITALFTAGLAAALPAPDSPLVVPPSPQDVGVKILNITATGTGCPQGSSIINLDSTGTIFDVAFDQYVVTVGPSSSAADSRKNCRVSINLSFNQGYS
jgi:hypothetical protein